MPREKTSEASPLVRELFTLGVYKPNQGRIVRRVTFVVLAATVAIGVWRLADYLTDISRAVEYGLLTVLLLVGMWLSYRIVNVPRFADFLIAVEAEMNKVSWPSRSELFRSSAVVLVTIIILALILYAYDLLWRLLLESLGVI